MNRFLQKVNENQLNICFKGQWFFIKKEDNPSKFESILSKLSKDDLIDADFESALSEVSLFNIQKNKDLEIVNGSLLILNERVPNVFCELIMNSFDNNQQTSGLIAFFKNSIYDTDLKENSETKHKLFSQFNDNSYCPDKRSQVVFINKKNDYPEFPFYNYSRVSENLINIFLDKKSINEIANNFSKSSNRIFEEFLLSSLCVPEEKQINESILYYLIIFKDIVHPDNLMVMYKKNLLKGLIPLLSKIDNYFFKEINTFFSLFSEKKIISLLGKDYQVFELIDIIHKYREISSLIDLSKSNYNSINQMYLAVSKEYNKFKLGPDFALNFETHFSYITDIHGKQFGDLIAIIPKSFYELIQWSSVMGNCIGSSNTFANKVNKGESFIFGFSKSKSIDEYNPLDIVCNVEISHDGSIVQIDNRKADRIDSTFISNTLSTYRK